MDMCVGGALQSKAGDISVKEGKVCILEFEGNISVCFGVIEGGCVPCSYANHTVNTPKNLKGKKGRLTINTLLSSSCNSLPSRNNLTRRFSCHGFDIPSGFCSSVFYGTSSFGSGIFDVRSCIGGCGFDVGGCCSSD